MCLEAATLVSDRYIHACVQCSMMCLPLQVLHSLPEVLLLMWTTNVDLRMRVELLELFAGEAKVSQAFREEGRSYVSYDCIYDPTGRSMNFLSSGGFAFWAQLVACMHTTADV